MTGSVSSRWAAWGSTPAGSSTRCMPTGSPVMRPICPHAFPFKSNSTANPAAMCLACRKISVHTVSRDRARHKRLTGRRHEHRDVHRIDRRGRDRSALPLSPGRAGRARLDPVPGLEGRDPRAVGERPVAAGALREEHPPAARAPRRPRRRALLRRPRARPGRARDHVDAGAAADDEHDGAPRAARRPGLADRGVLRRPGPALHDPGVLRPPYRLALAPLLQPRLAPRARHVGGRGTHPPLPDQGARRAAARPARSTAATAPGWTSSATPPRASTS